MRLKRLGKLDQDEGESEEEDDENENDEDDTDKTGEEGDWEDEEESEEDDEDTKLRKKYREVLKADDKRNLFGQPASVYPEHKWVVKWESWEFLTNYMRKSRYTNPDRFDMTVYTDFHGWGLQEQMENMINEFNAAWNKRDQNPSLHHMWGIVSGMGLWINWQDMGPLIGNEDGEHTCALVNIFGFALLSALAALKSADYLSPTSEFKDIALAISFFLGLVEDMPAYGIEEDSVCWAGPAVDYLVDNGFDPKMGVAGTKYFMDECKGSQFEEESEESKKRFRTTARDPWGWKDRLAAYKKQYKYDNGRIGGNQHDITKWTRDERKAHSYNGEDPLSDFTQEQLKKDLLDWR